MSYQDFATYLSAVDIGIYLVLFLIAFRRAGFRDRRMFTRTETVAVHARFIEGPVVSFLLLLALLTGAAAVALGTPDYARVAGFTVAAVRGGLFFVGAWLLGWYWRERRTWM